MYEFHANDTDISIIGMIISIIGITIYILFNNTPPKFKSSG